MRQRQRVLVRTSADPHGVVLDFTVAAWRAFIGGVRDGESDDFGSADWSKSSHSFSNGPCVEVADVPVSCFSATV